MAVRGRDIRDEGRAILDEFDAPELEHPGLARRSWRRFRRAPLVLQIGAAVLVFALWALILVAIFMNGNEPPKSPPPPTNSGATVAGLTLRRAF